MKPSNLRSCALLAILDLLAFPALSTTVIDHYPLQLSKKDRRMLEQMACIGPHGVPAEKMEVSTFRPGKLSGAHAEIDCKSHGTFREKPMNYSVRCEVTEGKWQCTKGDLRIVVPVDDREVIVSPGSYEPGFAYDTIAKLAGAGWFKDYSLAEVISSTCRLSPGMASEWIDVSCVGGEVTISSWCPQDECPRIVSIRP
jgi:hypothetical protein